MQIAEENDFKELFSEFYKDIGNVYSVFLDYAQAIDCYEKGLQYASGQRNNEIKKKLLRNLVGSCSQFNQTEKAKKYYNQLMKYIGKDELVEYFGYLGKATI